MPPPKKQASKALEDTHTAGDLIGNIGKGLKRVYGRKASRAYSILKDEIRPNVAGNLRGQIQNASARVMHSKTKIAVERLEKALIVISFVKNLMDVESQFEAVSESKDTAINKGVQYARFVDNAALKAVATALVSDAQTVVDITKIGLHRISTALGGGQGSKIVDAVARAADRGDEQANQLINDLFDTSKQDLWARRFVEYMR